MKDKNSDNGFDMPARLRDEHILLNPEAPQRYRRYAVRDDHPLTRAYERGQLDAGRRDHTARDRWEAGLIYRGLYEDIHGSGIALSKLVRVNGARADVRAGERVCAARDYLERIETKLSADNRFILRRVCGEGYRPAEAINARMTGFEKHVSQLLSAALDDLVDAVVRLKLFRRDGAEVR